MVIAVQIFKSPFQTNTQFPKSNELSIFSSTKRHDFNTWGSKKNLKLHFIGTQIQP